MVYLRFVWGAPYITRGQQDVDSLARVIKNKKAFTFSHKNQNKYIFLKRSENIQGLSKV